MTVGHPTELCVRFTPSKVEGLRDVSEVAVWPDRLEVRTSIRWSTYAFSTFAEPCEPRVVGRLRHLLGLRRCAGRVAESSFSRHRYEDSYVTFLTQPRLRVYMPPGGPTGYPDSLFWRIEQTIRRGGFAVSDAATATADTPPDAPPRPRWARALGGTLVALAFVNFLAFFLIALYLGGDAWNGKVDGGRYFLMSHGKYTEVSQAVWTYSWWHVISVCITHPLAFVGAFIAWGFRGRRPRSGFAAA